MLNIVFWCVLCACMRLKNDCKEVVKCQTLRMEYLQIGFVCAQNDNLNGFYGTKSCCMSYGVR